MAKKKNCWEVEGCGRESRGTKVDELGICPAALEERLNGVHEGINGGRCCWIVAGTFCGGKTQGTFAQKHKTCFDCDFYKLVNNEEFPRFEHAPRLLARLR